MTSALVGYDDESSSSDEEPSAALTEPPVASSSEQQLVSKTEASTNPAPQGTSNGLGEQGNDSGGSNDELAVDPDIQRRVDGLVARVGSSGVDFTSYLRSNAAFNNPAILKRLMTRSQVPQWVTNLPSTTWDPNRDCPEAWNTVGLEQKLSSALNKRMAESAGAAGGERAAKRPRT